MSSNVYVRPYRLLAFTKTCLCDYPHVRERLSRAQSTTIGNTGERRRWWWKQGASPIRMRLISLAELITFPESSQTSGHAHRSCASNAGSNRNRLKRNRFIGTTISVDLWRGVKDKFVTRLKHVFPSVITLTSVIRRNIE